MTKRIVPENLPEFQCLNTDIDPKKNPFFKTFRFFLQKPYCQLTQKHSFLYALCYERVLWSIATNNKCKAEGRKPIYEDSKGNTFIVLTRPQVMEFLNATEKTITGYFVKLEEFGLIKRVRIGYNAYHIYVRVPPEYKPEEQETRKPNKEKQQKQEEEPPVWCEPPETEDYPEDNYEEEYDEIPF